MAFLFFVQIINEEKPPVTTVFVGNISERAPDMMIKQMLQVKLLKLLLLGDCKSIQGCDSLKVFRALCC